jgi:hypothetical protein
MFGSSFLSSTNLQPIQQTVYRALVLTPIVYYCQTHSMMRLSAEKKDGLLLTQKEAWWSAFGAGRSTATH